MPTPIENAERIPELSTLRVWLGFVAPFFFRGKRWLPPKKGKVPCETYVELADLLNFLSLLQGQACVYCCCDVAREQMSLT